MGFRISSVSVVLVRIQLPGSAGEMDRRQPHLFWHQLIQILNSSCRRCSKEKAVAKMSSKNTLLCVTWGLCPPPPFFFFAQSSNVNIVSGSEILLMHLVAAAASPGPPHVVLCTGGSSSSLSSSSIAYFVAREFCWRETSLQPIKRRASSVQMLLAAPAHRQVLMTAPLNRQFSAS